MLCRVVNETLCESTTDDCVTEIALDNLVTAADLKIASSENAKLTQVRHFVH